jgi:hypothetical protein
VKSLPPGDRIEVRIAELDGDFEHGLPADWLLRHCHELCPSFDAVTLGQFDQLFVRINETQS